jgi:hypothetical protein
MLSPRTRFTRGTLTESEAAEVARVDLLAESLSRFLAESSRSIDAAHVHNAQSGTIQTIVSEVLRRKLGFREEVVLTPQDGIVTRARPDFYFSLEEGRGILAEVERGGTVNNNHDLKDLWKTHIAPDAQHLFLMVPMANWKPTGEPRERPYARVVNRLSAFFGDPRREIDVLSLNVFGYGAADRSH